MPVIQLCTCQAHSQPAMRPTRPRSLPDSLRGVLIVAGAALPRDVVDGLSPAQFADFVRLCGRFGLRIQDAGEYYELVA